MASTEIGEELITTCEFRSDTEFITCANRYVKFWSFDKLNLVSFKGNMDPFETSICASFAFIGRVCITGTSKGNLIVWNTGNVEKRITAHKGQVWILMAKENGVISGGEDGKLIAWTNEFKQLSSIDLAKVTRLNPGVRALDVNNSGVYVIGTKASEIIRIYQKKSTVLIRGHFEGEIWGLCVSPIGEKFATCGDDKTLRVYNIDKVTMILPLHETGKAIDWSSNANYIAFVSISGHIYCFDPNESLKTVSKVQSSFGKDQEIKDLKISPNNTMIAFGPYTPLAKIEIMKVNEKGDGLSKCYLINAGLMGGVTHLDWDVTSNFLVINSNSYELKYLNITEQKVQSSASSKDIAWYTWTCALGFPVQGIFNALSDGSDIQSVCRANSSSVIATGDSSGRVRLFKYPSIVKHAASKVYRGHSDKVNQVKFLFNDTYAVSVGGYDKTVIVWKCEIQKEQSILLNLLDVSEGKDIQALIYDETDTTKVDKEITELQYEKQTNSSEWKDRLEEVDQLIEVIISKPRLAGLKEPKEFIKPPYNQFLPPKINFELEHIYGYHSKNARNNLSYLADNNIGYHTAAAGVILDPKTNSQRFFLEHSNEILSIAFNAGKIATGELAPIPVIYIWNTITCLPITKFTGELERGVRTLAFSPNGEYLAAIDMSKSPNLVIYDIRNKVMMTRTKTEPTLILQITFKADDILITAGIKHFMYWKIEQSNFLSKRGIFKTYNDNIGCVAANKDLTLTGNAIGEIAQWNENVIDIVRRVHDSAIDCITLAGDL